MPRQHAVQTLLLHSFVYSQFYLIGLIAFIGAYSAANDLLVHSSAANNLLTHTVLQTIYWPMQCCIQFIGPCSAAYNLLAHAVLQTFYCRMQCLKQYKPRLFYKPSVANSTSEGVLSYQFITMPDHLFM